MKYYVVSEEELEQLVATHCQEVAAMERGTRDQEERAASRREKAEAAIRARPALYYSDAHDFDGKLLGSLWATNKVEIEK